MRSFITAIIPAHNEAERIGTTLRALQEQNCVDEIIVVDDGSKDQTAECAAPYANRVIRLTRNCGKGAALAEGVRNTRGDILLFLDADLEEHAKLCDSLLEPVVSGEVDMTIARFPIARRKGGFGLVKGLARWSVRQLTGQTIEATLSGQRAMKREVADGLLYIPSGFGIELGLTVHALRSGFSVKEIPLPMSHRETGRDLSGFLHRGKQFTAIVQTLIRLWRSPA